MSVDASYSADVSDGLLREYLHKLGCKRTLAVFDEERPRHAESITSRNVLRKTLGLERLAARLKKQNPEASLPTTLQMWVESQLEKVAAGSGGAKSPPAPKPAAKAKVWQAEEAHAEESVPDAAPSSRRARQAPLPARDPAPTRARAAAADAAAPPRAGRPMFGFGDDGGPSDAALLNKMAKSDARVPRSMQQPAGGLGRCAEEEEALMMEDVEDFDVDLGSEPLPAPRSSSRRGASGAYHGDQLSPDDARKLRELLWSGAKGPPPSWKQGFFFNSKPGLSYGLVQKEGGPCGVLAAVQAYVLDASFDGAGFQLGLSRSQQATLLAGALTTILWQAGGGRKAVLVGCTDSSTGGLSYEALCRSAATKVYRARDMLNEAILGNMAQLAEEDGYGLILFLFSLLLTRGIDAVRGDMDVADTSLMAAHGYCTQDLVNLIITGKAVSNVFDGDNQLDEHTLLKGIKRPSRVGLLTLFEWYKYVEVGSHLKNPQRPVWVVCSESHFTCLFAPGGHAGAGRPPFELLYYDGLANQEGEIRLSITASPTGGHTARAGETIGDRGNTEDNLVPPLEFVIETRWPGVAVDWNGTEPIL
eukprot:jgi/Tetstr1/462660/TSEL_000688.t1